MERDRLLIVHGGAPTAVMNASLYGVVTEARKQRQIGAVWGAVGGTGGFLQERFLPLSDIAPETLSRLPFTPGSAIGTSRTPLEAGDYARMRDICRAHRIGYVLFNGGNGTMDACGRLHEACADDGVRVIGIPKTIDNDIAVTDHAPGYGSAARYLAVTVAEICADVRAMPIHVCVVEAMGRNAGWLTASAALAGDLGFAPDLIYLPERPFSMARFLIDVQAVYAHRRGVVAVVSEGLRDEAGAPVVPPIFKTDRAVYYGDVGAHLAQRVIQSTGIKARSEKPGICGRASGTLQSPVDREEAAACGARAVRLAAEGASGVMVTIARDTPYAARYGSAPIGEVMLRERTLPPEYINEAGNGVTRAFADWCRPLLGGDLPPYVNLRPEGERA